MITIFVIIGRSMKMPLQVIVVKRTILIKREYVKSILFTSRIPGEPVVCERTLSANTL
jgi:hypothetical protein